jgi:hypothetical protein
MWKNTADWSIVTILSNIGIEWWQIILRNSSLVLTHSFFMLSLRSLGTHLADFLDRFRSSCSMAWMVLVDMLWTLVSFLTVTCLSLSTLAVISAMSAVFLTHLLVLKPPGLPLVTSP